MMLFVVCILCVGICYGSVKIVFWSGWFAWRCFVVVICLRFALIGLF